MNLQQCGIYILEEMQALQYKQLMQDCLRETNHEDEVYIGIVIYIDQEKEWHRVWSQSEVLVRKRISFEHEQELRAVTFQSQLTDLGKYVSVDLGILIEKIYVAPKAPRYFEDGIKSIAEI